MCKIQLKKWLVILILSLAISSTFTTCRQKIKDNSFCTATTNSEINYLAQVNKCSLEIIQLSNLMISTETNSDTIKILNEIRNNQLEIDTKLKQFAYKKLILLSINPLEQKSDYSENLCTKLISAIRNEIKIFQEVQRNTNDKEIINYISNSLIIAVSNLNKLEKILT